MTKVANDLLTKGLQVTPARSIANQQVQSLEQKLQPFALLARRYRGLVG